MPEFIAVVVDLNPKAWLARTVKPSTLLEQIIPAVLKYCLVSIDSPRSSFLLLVGALEDTAKILYTNFTVSCGRIVDSGNRFSSVYDRIVEDIRERASKSGKKEEPAAASDASNDIARMNDIWRSIRPGSAAGGQAFPGLAAPQSSALQGLQRAHAFPTSHGGDLLDEEESQSKLGRAVALCLSRLYLLTGALLRQTKLLGGGQQSIISSLASRILIVTPGLCSPFESNVVLNSIFTARKAHAFVDAVVIAESTNVAVHLSKAGQERQEASLPDRSVGLETLKQACVITGGLFLSLVAKNLNELYSILLYASPNPLVRAILPPKALKDPLPLRGKCSMCGKSVEQANVCSVCLVITCDDCARRFGLFTDKGFAPCIRCGM